MKCPSCGDEPGVRARHTRTDSNNTVIRRRHCTACGHRWYTAEIPIPSEAVTHGFTEGKTRSTFELKGSVLYSGDCYDTFD